MTPISANLALVADPDPEARDLYREVLSPVMSEMEYAEDGRDALAIAIGHLPGFVITETRLAFINGYTLCSLLRADPMTANVPIVVITIDTKPEDIERARVSGADNVLMKPCAPEALLQSVAVGRNRSRSSNALSTAMSADATGQSIRNDTIEPVTEQARRVLTRAHRRFNTTIPPVAPPPLRCPSCDQALQYVSSNIGGVSARFSEQWDYYTCTSGCGAFQYRQRTRRVRRIEEHAPLRGAEMRSRNRLKR
jgi:CheY-like chemotaxis protein